MNRTDKRGSRRSGLAKQSRHKKALFLPMDRGTANELVLPVRIAFERIRHGKVDRDAAVCMAEILLLTGFLTESGFGLLDVAFLDGVEKRLLTELNREGLGEWKFAAALVDELGVVVNEYDRLVRETRLHAIVEANESLSRLKPTARKI
ncbi:Fis family transcriptional regulator [Paraburkholderia sp. UYCP14C]|uniref:Fis family transcriptional regulator n=1 Tax=Paraburkholderia sp. UYCP14C TaxID=2511130 RepID=UPI00102298FC|nr:Fis family transcriptional regulator [Paraburkholderia sp. UYCP14C]RZF26082.1 Fis family transcriptional regulator [Paraburkholderia sp. UYCP14C]